jgi:hypothetical protein
VFPAPRWRDEFAGKIEIARICFDFPRECGEQTGFAAAVTADDAHAPSGLQGEVHLGQKKAFAPAQSEITERNHGLILFFLAAVKHLNFSIVSMFREYTRAE